MLGIGHIPARRGPVGGAGGAVCEDHLALEGGEAFVGVCGLARGGLIKTGFRFYARTSDDSFIDRRKSIRHH